MHVVVVVVQLVLPIIIQNNLIARSTIIIQEYTNKLPLLFSNIPVLLQKVHVPEMKKNTHNIYIKF